MAVYNISNSTLSHSIQGLMSVSRDPNTTESVELHRMLFNPYSLWGTGGLDSAIGSAIGTPLAKSDPYFSVELTEKLFQNPVKTDQVTTRKTVGLDLVSLNIQRGRDHGLPAYTEWRRYCRLPAADTWQEMAAAVDSESLANMKSIYKYISFKFQIDKIVTRLLFVLGKPLTLMYIREH